MPVLCGNCHKTHESPSDVRRCYSSGSSVATETLVRASALATDRQMSFIIDLLGRKDLPSPAVVSYQTEVETKQMTKDRASAVISHLLNLRDKPKPVVPAEDLGFRPGRYALQNQDGEWGFFEVFEWNGRMLLSRLHGAPGSFGKIAVRNPQQRNEIFKQIAVDPRQAAVDFGKHTGICGVCGSPLTNAESVAYGIGPVCRAKTGW